MRANTRQPIGRHPSEAVVEIEIQHRSADPWEVLDISGEIDLSTAPALRSHLDELIHGGTRRLVINLTPVSFMDSTGLSVLVSAVKSMRDAGGEISVVCTNPAIAKIFTITRLDQLLAVHPSVDAAVAV